MDSKRREIDYKRNLRVYFSFLKRYKLLAFSLFLLILITEVLFSLDRFFFKAIIDQGTIFASGEISQNVFAAFLLNLALLYIGISVGRVFFRWIRMTVGNKQEALLQFDLKQKYFNHLMELSHGFHTTHKTGSFISRISRGSSAMDKMNEFLFFNALPLIVQFFIIIFSISYFDSKTMIVIVVMAFLFIVWSLFVQRIQKPYAIANNRAEDIEKGNMADFFTNVDSIKYFGKESYIGQRYAALGTETMKTELKRSNYQRLLRNGSQIIISVGTLLVFYFSLIRFLNGDITIGAIALIYTMYGSLIPYLNFFTDGLRGFFRSMEDFEDLLEYGMVENDIKDKKNAMELEIREGDVKFKNVNFSYQGRNIFRNLSLHIPKNKKVAFVGKSGSGKTTLVKLLYRLYDVDSGEIMIDNENINNFKQKSLRRELSIVPQECVLFDDTIYNNILFSRPEATRMEVMNAIKVAQLDSFISRLPQKEKTVVGERGVKLSGGEKQRVSIARALLANKRILVLDEATSSLDSHTEHELQKGLWKLMEGRTTLIIAHRLSTIMHADMIVVLDKGKIVQIGKHNELLKQKGMYKTLWEMQKGGYIGED